MLLRRDPGRVPHELEELHQVVDSGYHEVRRYMNVLREPRQQEERLWAALDRVAAEFQTRHGLRVHMVRQGGEPELAPATTHDLTQIAREALGNALRHGHASKVVIRVSCRPTHLMLVVRDNGTGFTNGHGRVDADGFLAPAATPWSIRERTAALGGALRVRSTPGQGAEIMVTIPAAGPGGRYGSDRRMYA